ncbi:MAG TPA: protein-disulfide reductase DsbD [Gammaproteobacteria bacterium]|nr:protein-disulfide reductase DsbD [Gammaproteobacteria bacterium]
MKKFFVLMFIFLSVPLSSLRADTQPLPPEQVYRLQVQPRNGVLMAHWDILPGYYLYKNKFQFISHTPSIVLGAPQFPSGEQHSDPYFGAQEIYRNGVTASIPYTGSGSLQLEVKYQGCADMGFCYPPQSQQFNLTLAEHLQAPAITKPGVVAAVHPPDLAALVNDGNSGNSFPPPDQVFQIMAQAKDANTVEVSWQIADGYYLYRQKFHFTSSDPEIALGAPDFPQGQIENDQYFGTSEIYRHSVSAMIPVTRSSDATTFDLTATYQGCADKGLCYPPITKTLNIDFAAPGMAAIPNAATKPQTSITTEPGSQQGRLAELIRHGNLAWVLLVFLGLGLALTFTPCVLPMIPIIAGLIAGQHEKPSTRRAFLLSLVYVLTMALTYTTAGVIVALIGANLQAWFQNPWIVSVFSLIFVLLALSMFGLYELQMPSAIQTRLVGFSNTQKGGAFVGVGIMGVLSALIVGPCITAPLVAALLVIGQSGDALRGGLSLFALGIGMGIPLLIVGTSAGKLVPKAGPWMQSVKSVLGVLLLGVAIWFLSRILPGPLTLALWAALTMFCGIYLLLADIRDGWRKLSRAVGMLAIVYGIILLVGAAIGGSDPFQPLARLKTASLATRSTHSQGLRFSRIKTLADLNQALAQASRNHQTVMLDFYADWCVSCKEMQHGAFVDPGVLAALANTVLLQADVTANDAGDQALLKHFGIYGPPSIMFFDASGQELTGLRVVGYMDARDFEMRIHQIFKTTGAVN